eukprot:CAMPEP_0184661208 /NCGR_PEP_ID=MMETSP0308-20130426/37359_1 /TAXON_ID=38269 /ORGANISM="Gloeochaete witrockiana, Strain SAG 46.84" /LENGTH=164 /DNA_ID=CAMNT_0027102339 /DNA_START=515 /DNA_END=1009 /DNA_ORIENTATION=+
MPNHALSCDVVSCRAMPSVERSATKQRICPYWIPLLGAWAGTSCSLVPVGVGERRGACLHRYYEVWDRASFCLSREGRTATAVVHRICWWGRRTFGELGGNELCHTDNSTGTAVPRAFAWPPPFALAASPISCSLQEHAYAAAESVASTRLDLFVEFPLHVQHS